MFPAITKSLDELERSVAACSQTMKALHCSQNLLLKNESDLAAPNATRDALLQSGRSIGTGSFVCRERENSQLPVPQQPHQPPPAVEYHSPRRRAYTAYAHMHSERGTLQSRRLLVRPNAQESTGKNSGVQLSTDTSKSPTSHHATSNCSRHNRRLQLNSMEPEKASIHAAPHRLIAQECYEGNNCRRSAPGSLHRSSAAPLGVLKENSSMAGSATTSPAVRMDAAAVAVKPPFRKVEYNKVLRQTDAGESCSQHIGAVASECSTVQTLRHSNPGKEKNTTQSSSNTKFAAAPLSEELSFRSLAHKQIPVALESSSPTEGSQKTQDAGQESLQTEAPARAATMHAVAAEPSALVACAGILNTDIQPVRISRSRKAMEHEESEQKQRVVDSRQSVHDRNHDNLKAVETCCQNQAGGDGTTHGGSHPQDGSELGIEEESTSLDSAQGCSTAHTPGDHRQATVGDAALKVGAQHTRTSDADSVNIPRTSTRLDNHSEVCDMESLARKPLGPRDKEESASVQLCCKSHCTTRGAHMCSAGKNDGSTGVSKHCSAQEVAKDVAADLRQSGLTRAAVAHDRVHARNHDAHDRVHARNHHKSCRLCGKSM